MSIWRIPRFVTQRDAADPEEFSHCWAAIGAWDLDGATDGASHVSAAEFAKMAGGGSGRLKGSGTQEDIVQGLNRYGVKASIISLTRQDVLPLLATERRSIFAFAVDYDAWPELKDCMTGTAGPDVNHMVGVITGPKLQIENPLCHDYQTVKADVLIEAAFKYARQGGHSRYIEVVRTFRQKPTADIGQAALVADQKDQLDQWAEYAASVRAIADRLLDVKAPS